MWSGTRLTVFPQLHRPSQSRCPHRFNQREGTVRPTRREIMAGSALLTVAAVTKIAQAQQVPAPKSPADVLTMPAGTIMTKDYVRMIGRMAYVWGWPMVN